MQGRRRMTFRLFGLHTRACPRSATRSALLVRLQWPRCSLWHHMIDSQCSLNSCLKDRRQSETKNAVVNIGASSLSGIRVSVHSQVVRARQRLVSERRCEKLRSGERVYSIGEVRTEEEDGMGEREWRAQAASFVPALIVLYPSQKVSGCWMIGAEDITRSFGSLEYCIKNQEEAGRGGSLADNGTCRPLSDYVFKLRKFAICFFRVTPKASLLYHELSVVCQGKLTLCINQLTKYQIALLTCVPLIKSPFHTPASPTALHHLPAQGHRF